ncbi:MAG: class I SAM-dependent methyltransferase [Myxococcales bacterium]|nr:class I SAM-dependent methyltransferase [Myxococcales bacterium]
MASATSAVDAVARAADEAALDLGTATLDRLAAYVALLQRHAAAANLVGTDDALRIARELVVDSARLVPFVAAHLGAEGSLVDVGAGAGLPGIPLLLALPRWTGTAVEPRERRRTFMALARRELDLTDRLRITDGRLDDDGLAATPPVAPARLLVSKAVFAPAEWLARARRVTAGGGGVGVFGAARELAPLAPSALAWSEYSVPGTTGGRVVALFGVEG